MLHGLTCSFILILQLGLLPVLYFKDCFLYMLFRNTHGRDLPQLQQVPLNLYATRVGNTLYEVKFNFYAEYIMQITSWN